MLHQFLLPIQCKKTEKKTKIKTLYVRFSITTPSFSITVKHFPEDGRAEDYCRLDPTWWERGKYSMRNRESPED